MCKYFQCLINDMRECQYEHYEYPCEVTQYGEHSLKGYLNFHISFYCVRQFYLFKLMQSRACTDPINVRNVGQWALHDWNVKQEFAIVVYQCLYLKRRIFKTDINNVSMWYLMRDQPRHNCWSFHNFIVAIWIQWSGTCVLLHIY